MTTRTIPSSLKSLAERDRNLGIAVGRAFSASGLLLIGTFAATAITVLAVDRHYLQERYDWVFRRYVEQTVTLANARNLEAVAQALSAPGGGQAGGGAAATREGEAGTEVAPATLSLLWQRIGSVTVPQMASVPIRLHPLAKATRITAGPFSAEECVATLSVLSPAFALPVTVSAGEAPPADASWAVPTTLSRPAQMTACAAPANHMHIDVPRR